MRERERERGFGKRKKDALSMHGIANPCYGMTAALYGFDMAR